MLLSSSLMSFVRLMEAKEVLQRLEWLVDKHAGTDSFISQTMGLGELD
jgi:hypothetical protein